MVTSGCLRQASSISSIASLRFSPQATRISRASPWKSGEPYASGIELSMASPEIPGNRPVAHPTGSSQLACLLITLRQFCTQFQKVQRETVAPHATRVACQIIAESTFFLDTAAVGFRDTSEISLVQC